MFANREASRASGSPTKLYLFRGAEPSLESLMRSVTIIPGTTEFGYGTTKVTDATGKVLNGYTGTAVSDFEESVNDLLAIAPDLDHVSLVVSWHGTDLRAGVCDIKPKVEFDDTVTTPYDWYVGGLDRASADVVTRATASTDPAVGGAPADRTVWEALTFLKAKGLRVTMYPFIMMDIEAGNGLTDPYGGSEQGAYPWRGRITCSPAIGQPSTADRTAAADTQINTFFGTAAATDFGWDATNKRVTYSGPAAWKFRRFILHMATLAKNGGADDFLIGSEMVGITRVRGAADNFVGVENFVALAQEARDILGGTVRISYAADWSEYHSYRPGSDIFFNMDDLWSDSNIDYIGIDNYMPLSDWRDGNTHLDRLAGYPSIYDHDYIRANIEGGEYYDWYYASTSDRNAQIRTPINDFYSKHWVYRQKDIYGWWSNAHRNRPGGVEDTGTTSWVAESKPVVFTELGVPAVEKGTNQPNVFVDPKSSESFYPYYSNQRTDAAIQRIALEAVLSYWRDEGAGMIEWNSLSIWTWDARPYPMFPERDDIFGDAENWAKGHWLTGRIAAGRSFSSGTFGPYAFTDGETAVVRNGITYVPWPINVTDINQGSTLDKSDVTVTLARGSGIETEFLGFPPAQVVNLTIFQGHMEDAPTLFDYPAVWLGRIGAPEFVGNEVSFNCVPVSSSIQRPGLRRNYQIGCPHALFGPQCRANKEVAGVNRTVTAFTGSTMTVGVALTSPEKYAGGVVEWTTPSGKKEIRTIVSATSTILSVRGAIRGVEVGTVLRVTLGCNHTEADCADLHNNIVNYGGQPFIPLENPISRKNQFF